MLWLCVTVFGFQGIAMFFDECYFHRRRGLPLWERIGHPIDTTSVIVCLSYAMTHSPTGQSFRIYTVFCVISCLLVTKDEFVHRRVCDASESWIHAVLFILHPLALIIAGLIWYSETPYLLTVLSMQVVISVSFLTYQIVYWNFLWKKKLLA